MDLALFLLAFTMFWRSSSGLRCYACEPRSSTYHALLPRVCENFDGSDNYIEQCDTSTMCFKRESTVSFGNGITTTTYHRGCAPQTFSGDQEKVNKKWQYVTHIYEVYKEECQTDSNIDSLANTVNCYCRGELCNSANSIFRSQTILYFIAIHILLIIA